MATGKAEKLPIDEIRTRVREAAKKAIVYPFVPELLPSLCEFFARYPREHINGPPYTYWRNMFHYHSHEVWLAIRCRVCQKLRRVGLRYLAILHQRQYEDIWRQCKCMQGAQCGALETDRIYNLDLKGLVKSVYCLMLTITDETYVQGLFGPSCDNW